LPKSFGRTPTRTGLKERFPKLRVDRYLVVKPEIVGPNFKEFTSLYNEIFRYRQVEDSENAKVGEMS